MTTTVLQNQLVYRLRKASQSVPVQRILKKLERNLLLGLVFGAGIAGVTNIAPACCELAKHVAKSLP